MNRIASFVLFILAAAACGGGGGGSDLPTEVPADIHPASEYEALCAKPRTVKDASGKPMFPDQPGNLLAEQLWLRSWIDDTYLWYKEVPQADPKKFTTAVDYFDVLKTGAVTPSGTPKDHFHFFYDTDFWISLSQGGASASYGLTWALLKSSPPRVAVVAFVQPNTPAAAANIKRGALAITVDGADVANGSDVDKLNAGLFPSNPGETHTLVIQDQAGGAQRTVTLMSANIASKPVQRVDVAGHPKVGYLLFNDHIATAEKGLVDEITALKAAGITDLVLDIRYNGGGYLAIAAQLAYMIAGPTATAGKAFDQLQFNDKHPTVDPVTGQTITPEPFISTGIDLAQDGMVPNGTPLPHLDLTTNHVYVLTGPGTCSASEAVMNGLAGVDVIPIQIGKTTCGKPYGFYPTDNCSTTYFAIQFKGINAKGFGDYTDGFVPGVAPSVGCTVEDDFTHDLGNPAEARLATALSYMTNHSCPAGVARSSNPLAAIDGVVPKPLWLQNAILLPPRR